MPSSTDLVARSVIDPVVMTRFVHGENALPLNVVRNHNRRFDVFDRLFFLLGSDSETSQEQKRDSYSE